mgnify:CR=1 FL=1
MYRLYDGLGHGNGGDSCIGLLAELGWEIASSLRACWAGVLFVVDSCTIYWLM